MMVLFYGKSFKAVPGKPAILTSGALSIGELYILTNLDGFV